MTAYAPCTGQTTVRRYISGLTVAANNPAFREWGAELDANLILAGLTQTSDTGQIDWTTVTWPGANTTAAGYTIWRFNDLLKTAAPIYFKIEYGRGSSVNTPQFWITVGTGSDGAGTITNIFFPRQVFAPNTGIANAGVLQFAMPTFISVNEGFFGLAWKCNVVDATVATITDSMLAGLFLSRTVDATGNSTPLGITMLTHSLSGGNSLQQICRRFPTVAATYGAYDCAGVILSQGAPDYPVTSGALGGAGGSSRSYQTALGAYSTQMRAYPIWTTMPRVMPLSHVCTVIPRDFSIGKTFYANVLGARQRRYITVGARGGVGVSDTIGVPMLAMLWE